MGAVNSACQSCFGAIPKPEQSTRPTKKPLEIVKTCEATIEDLDKSDKGDTKSNKSGGNMSFDDSLDQSETGRQDKHHQKLSLGDFNLIKIVGQGSFGKIYLVQKKSNKKYYALKTMKKRDLVLKNLLKCVLNERNILKDIKHPFVVSLKCSFQTKTRVYMVMEYCPGGDLLTTLKKQGKFDEITVKYYAAELVLALEYLHDKLHIIHRDLKAENILIAADNHLKIADFGLAKTSTNALTLCGTPDYLAPEVIWGKPYDQTIDWWGLGCLMYEMLTGHPPFSQPNRDKLVADIMTAEVKMQSWFSSSLQSLLSKLLTKNPKQRLGASGAAEVKNHPFFKGIDWDAMLNKKVPPPVKLVSTHKETSLYSKPSGEAFSLENFENCTLQDNYHFDFPQFSYVGKDAVTEIEEEKK